MEQRGEQACGCAGKRLIVSLASGLGGLGAATRAAPDQLWFGHRAGRGERLAGQVATRRERAGDSRETLAHA